MDLGLKNKIAMVGGASKGLGYAVARALAAEGASVSMASRDHDAIRGAAGTIQRETGSRAVARRGEREEERHQRRRGAVARAREHSHWSIRPARGFRTGGGILAVRCRVVHHRSVGAGRWGFDQGCSLMLRSLIADFRFLIGCRFELQWDRSQSAISCL